MAGVYDNWEKLVRAMLKREQRLRSADYQEQEGPQCGNDGHSTVST